MQKYAYITALITGCMLAGCSGDVKDSLGLRKDAPDEFRVISMPPLTIPPDFDLRPPVEKKNDPALSASAQAAKQSVFGKEAAAVPALTVRGMSLPTPAESILLNKAGTNKNDPQIRTLLAEENKVTAPEPKKGWFSKLKTLSPKKSTEEPVVNPEEERKRLRENKKAGKSVTEGETPTLKNQKSPLEKLLD